MMDTNSWPIRSERPWVRGGWAVFGALSLLTLWPQFNDPSFNLFLGMGWLFAGFMDLGYFPMTVASFVERVHPDDRARVQAATRAAIDDGAPAEIEHRIVRLDGRVSRVHQRGVVARDATVPLVIGVATGHRVIGLFCALGGMNVALALFPPRVSVWIWLVVARRTVPRQLPGVMVSSITARLRVVVS